MFKSLPLPGQRALSLPKALADSAHRAFSPLPAERSPLQVLLVLELEVPARASDQALRQGTRPPAHERPAAQAQPAPWPRRSGGLCLRCGLRRRGGSLSVVVGYRPLHRCATAVTDRCTGVLYRAPLCWCPFQPNREGHAHDNEPLITEGRVGDCFRRFGDFFSVLSR